MTSKISRRTFIQHSTIAALGSGLISTAAAAASNVNRMRFGLVTYLWGQDLDLPTLLVTCEKSGIRGVELRTEHKHGVEPSLSSHERSEVKKRFADSPVTLVGYGSNAQFHESDPAKVKANIELTKQYVQLMHDCGGSGVKVKPNGFSPDVSHEKTIEQIGQSLNIVARYAADFGQQIRVEAHGRGTQELDVMQAIFEVADHKNATVCWNCNTVDTNGQGLEHNFNRVKNRLGATVHVHELGAGSYPYQELINLLKGIDYQGWILLEAGGNPDDKVAALTEQRALFKKMIR